MSQLSDLARNICDRIFMKCHLCPLKHPCKQKDIDSEIQIAEMNGMATEFAKDKTEKQYRDWFPKPKQKKKQTINYAKLKVRK